MTIAPGTASILQQMARYRWSPGRLPGTSVAPFAAGAARHRFPSRSVVGEIKPHHPTGIAAGIIQLRGRALAGRTPQLITYRQVRGRPSYYTVQAADSHQLSALLTRLGGPRGRRLTPADLASLTTWYSLGDIRVPAATKPIPLWQCATAFGFVIEQYIRDHYDSLVAAKMKAKDPRGAGADISHEMELAAFLRELAADLESELATRIGPEWATEWTPDY